MVIFDHLGVVVRDVETETARLTRILGIRDWTAPMIDPLQKVFYSFGRDRSDLRFEVIAPSDDSSPIARALSSRVNILNHIAYRVPDLAAAAADLRRERCPPAGAAQPGVAFGGRLVQFFLTPLGMLLELIEDPAPVGTSHG